MQDEDEIKRLRLSLSDKYKKKVEEIDLVRDRRHWSV